MVSVHLRIGVSSLAVLKQLDPWAPICWQRELVQAYGQPASCLQDVSGATSALGYDRRGVVGGIGIECLGGRRSAVVEELVVEQKSDVNRQSDGHGGTRT